MRRTEGNGLSRIGPFQQGKRLARHGEQTPVLKPCLSGSIEKLDKRSGGVHEDVVNAEMIVRGDEPGFLDDIEASSA